MNIEIKKHFVLAKILNHQTLVSKDAEIKTLLPQLKFGIIYQLSVRALRS